MGAQGEHEVMLGRPVVYFYLSSGITIPSRKTFPTFRLVFVDVTPPYFPPCPGRIWGEVVGEASEIWNEVNTTYG